MVESATPIAFPQFLTVAAVARLLAKDEWFVRREIRARRLGSVQLGASLRIDVADLQTYIDARRVPAVPPVVPPTTPPPGRLAARVAPSDRAHGALRPVLLGRAGGRQTGPVMDESGLTERE